MTHASGEPMAASPLWLAASGLPALLNDKINRNAWLVFKTVVETDCERNVRPSTVEITPAELAERCGLPPDVVMRTLEGLRRRKCLALFLPEHPEEHALIEVRIPLPTPVPAEAVRAKFPFNRLEEGVRLRYSAAETAPAPAPGDARDLDRLIDLYFNNVGFKMNGFILDELRLICQRFSRRDVEKAFERAGKNDIRSLHWVAKDLYRTARRHERGKG